jgi:hypothetical protein
LLLRCFFQTLEQQRSWSSPWEVTNFSLEQQPHTGRQRGQQVQVTWQQFCRAPAAR